mmetsp:Transcript_88330/g.245147  ORF Transcript_88330/g.245147 Transcript_88330/m.245147 type:complete len:325 (-) Transcript_88330:77-1051(-)
MLDLIEYLVIIFRTGAAQPAVKQNVQVVQGHGDEEDALWHFLVLYPTLLQAETQVDAHGCSNASATMEILDAVARKELVDWLLNLQELVGSKQAALFLTVQLIDRFLRQQPVQLDRLRLLGGSAFLLASKFEDCAPPSLESVVSAGEGCFTAAEVRSMELAVLRQLNFRLHLPTAAHHLEWFQPPCHPVVPGLQEMMAWFLCELGLGCLEAHGWAPSLHAAAAALVAAALLSQRAPPLLENITTLGRQPKLARLQEIAAALWHALEELYFAEDCTTRAIYVKYAKHRSAYVALRAGTLLRAFPGGIWGFIGYFRATGVERGICL